MSDEIKEEKVSSYNRKYRPKARTAQQVIYKAVQILADQIDDIYAISYTTKLTNADLKLVGETIKTLIAVSKEERDAARHEDLSKLTDKELAELIPIAQGILTRIK